MVFPEILAEVSQRILLCQDHETVLQTTVSEFQQWRKVDRVTIDRFTEDGNGIIE